MFPQTNHPIPSGWLQSFCTRWNITEMALFGSVLREDFQPDSDVDILVTFSRDTHWSLFDLIRMQDEIKQVLGREVDLVERTSVESNPKYIRRKNILQNLQVIYATG